MRPRDALGAIQHLTRSFTVRLSILLIIFIAIPIIVYGQLKAADDRKTQLLHDTVVQEDRLVVEVLKPFLEKFGRDQPQDLQNTLKRLAENGTNIKLLFRPDTVASQGFFFIASAPPLPPQRLEEERRQLVKLGVFQTLDSSCRAGPNPVARYTNPEGLEEMLTSLTSVSTPSGCWAIVTSRSSRAFLRAARDKPFWETSEMQIALLIYIFSALFILWLFASIWRNMALFRGAARKIRLRGASASFTDANRIPELTGVAEDFDSLVGALTESQVLMQRAAEENAHALKAPLAVIAQSMEPLKKVVPGDAAPALRSLDLIERSVERLDALVSAGRDLDQASADAVFPRRWRVNMSTVVAKLLAAYENSLSAEGKILVQRIEPDLHVMASEDLIELVLENLLDNASSFTLPGAAITVSVSRVGNAVRLSVEDEGPGVPPQFLGKIFDRYFSHRPVEHPSRKGAGTDHFGLGLWIVKRNVEGVGGSVHAALRDPKGLIVTLEFPHTR